MLTYGINDTRSTSAPCVDYSGLNVKRSGLVHKIRVVNTDWAYETVSIKTVCGLNVKHNPVLRRRTTQDPVTCLTCLAH